MLWLMATRPTCVCVFVYLPNDSLGFTAFKLMFTFGEDNEKMNSDQAAACECIA